MYDSKQELLNWCASVEWTHSGTINHLDEYSPDFVCNQFLRNFNREIFGKDNPYRTVLFPLRVLAVAADDTKNKHIHFSFGGFPKDMYMPRIREAFHKAAKHTKGIRFKETKGVCVKLPMVKIDEDPTPEKWRVYILRFSKDLQDRHILLDHCYFG